MKKVFIASQEDMDNPRLIAPEKGTICEVIEAGKCPCCGKQEYHIISPKGFFKNDTGQKMFYISPFFAEIQKARSTEVSRRLAGLFEERDGVREFDKKEPQYLPEEKIFTESETF